MEDIIKIYQNKIDDMTWSFSRLNSWANGCKFCWFYNYILGDRGDGNAFADYGSLIHDLLEKFLKGELAKEELEIEFINRYNDEVGEFPFINKFVNLKESYFKNAIAYFETFDGFENYEVLEVETNIKVKIDKYEFTGYIDLLGRNKKNGKLIMIDHKSKKGFKTKEESRDYARQLYLYSIYAKEKYDEYPSLLIFNLFRKQQRKTIIFKEKDYLEAQKWVVDTINDIRHAVDFPVIGEVDEEENFFGEKLCNHRDNFMHIIGQNYTLKDLWEDEV